MSLHPLEKRVLNSCKIIEIKGLKLIVAVSGGLDSVVLLEILSQFQQLFTLELEVAHYHHGLALHASQNKYRDQVADFVEVLAKSYGYTYRSNKNSEDLVSSEAKLREQRYAFLNQLVVNQRDRLVLAHHCDDLLETRLIRLIRGTGLQGLEAMSMISGNLMRPLLQEHRGDLEAYAQDKKLLWWEDPSNKDLKYLRNWLRQEWLPQLEKKQPGAKASLAGSLDRLAEKNRTDRIEGCLDKDVIDYQLFLSLDFEDKKSTLARYMRTLEMKNYGQSHIFELLKRLDTQQKEYTFILLKHEWQVNAEHIRARPAPFLV